VANQVEPRSTAEALLKTVAVERVGTGGGEQSGETVAARYSISGRGVGHYFHERLIGAPEPIQEDEIGRGGPSWATSRLTTAQVNATGILRRVAQRRGRRKR